MDKSNHESEINDIILHATTNCFALAEGVMNVMSDHYNNEYVLKNYDKTFIQLLINVSSAIIHCKLSNFHNGKGHAWIFIKLEGDCDWRLLQASQSEHTLKYIKKFTMDELLKLFEHIENKQMDKYCEMLNITMVKGNEYDFYIEVATKQSLKFPSSINKNNISIIR